MGPDVVKIKTRKEYRKLVETMVSLLSPLKQHCDTETQDSIEMTLRILANNVEVEEKSDAE